MDTNTSLKHQGLHRHRLHDPRDPGCSVAARERCFAEAWEEANRQNDVLNVLSRVSNEEGAHLEPGFGRYDVAIPVNEEQAVLAATVVQWLGSPVGFSFLERTLAKAGWSLVPAKPSKP